MTFPTEPGEDLAQVVSESLGDRGCPLCTEQAWDFDGLRVVFLLDAKEARDLANAPGRTRSAGPRLSGRHRSDYDGALDWLDQHLSPVGQAAERNRLVQLSCNNCGHSELLAASKLGV